MCDAACAGGQGGCAIYFFLSQGGCLNSYTGCCQFYDVVTRMCITTCPAGSINTTDFTCGTYTIMFKLSNINCYPQIPVLFHLVKIKERVQLCQVRVINATVLDFSSE